MAASKPRHDGSITWTNGDQGPIKKGSITFNGGKASILDYDAAPDAGGRRGKPQTVDILKDIEVTERGKQVIVVGKSLHAIREMKLPEAQATIEVILDLTGKCKGCS